MTQLHDPFPMSAIQVRISNVSEAKKRARVLYYADTRAYQDRLDQVFGMASWHVDLTPITATVIKARVTVYDDTGEPTHREALGEDSDPMAAEARAFKRACSGLGIGRYLYDSPQLWADAYQSGKHWYLTDNGKAWALDQFAAWCQYTYPGWSPDGQQREQEQPAAPAAQRPTMPDPLHADPPHRDFAAPPSIAPGSDWDFAVPPRPVAVDPDSDTSSDGPDAHPSWWKFDQDAQDWAVREGYCANEFEARGSYLKQMKAVVGEPRQMTEAERAEVFAAFYARQLEKGKRHVA